MIRLALLLLLLTSLSFAAPVPKVDQERLRAAFGTVPESASGTVAFANGRLTLTTDGVQRSEFGSGGDQRWPTHTERAVSGDFVVEVTLLTASRPTQDRPKHDARVRSGLYIRSGGDSIVLGKFVRVDTSDDGKTTAHDESLWLQDNGHGTRMMGLAHDETGRVRIARTGGKVEAFYLTDKGEWKRTRAIEARLGDEVTVGVVVLPEVNQKVDATFADFTLLKK